MSIVIFGGSFDPIHKGHLNLINHMFTQIDDMEVFYVVPTGSHPELKKYFFTDDERLIMLQTTLGQLTEQEYKYYRLEKTVLEADYSKIVISDFELTKQGYAYTIDTIMHFKELHKNTTIHLLVGADQSQNFSTWHKSKTIAQLVNLWVYPRKGYTIDSNFEWNIIESLEYDVSSTKIKQNLSNNSSLDHIDVPITVDKLIHCFFKKK